MLTSVPLGALSLPQGGASFWGLMHCLWVAAMGSHWRLLDVSCSGLCALLFLSAWLFRVNRFLATPTSRGERKQGERVRIPAQGNGLCEVRETGGLQPCWDLKDGQGDYSSENKGKGMESLLDLPGPVCLPTLLILPTSYTTRGYDFLLSFRETQP